MKATEPGWELYRSFLAVVRARSLSGAARQLRLTQPTIGRHVDALESALGVALFTRSQLGLNATSAALELVPFAEAMESAASALRRVASGEEREERGAVRVTASEMVGSEVLPPLLAEFRELHPRIDVELVLSNRTDDLLTRQADIAVRMVQPRQAALLAKKLGTIRLGFHAQPRYLQLHGTPRSLQELREHPIVGFDSAASVRSLPKLQGQALTRELFAFRCDSDLGQYAAIRAGYGVGVCQRGLAKRDGLVAILSDVFGWKLGVWLVMHKDLRATRRVRLMFEHLDGGLRRYIAGQG